MRYDRNLDAIAREGAKRMLAQALKAEVRPHPGLVGNDADIGFGLTAVGIAGSVYGEAGDVEDRFLVQSCLRQLNTVGFGRIICAMVREVEPPPLASATACAAADIVSKPSWTLA